MLPASPPQLFRFCQLDFSFPLGPADGRYLARAGDEDLEVVIIRTLGAPRRSSVRGRRPKRAEPAAAAPEPVSISRVMVIDSVGFEDEAAATGWLDRCRKDQRERDQAVEHALSVVNRAIHAHRIAAGDPYEPELTRDRALSTRLGYGSGDDLVEGHWRAAYSLPAPRLRSGRRHMLAPQEQVAAILSGRSPVYPSEDLALRARLDLEQGRTRQAAIQLRAAADALEAELEAMDDTERGKLRSGGGGAGGAEEAQPPRGSVHELAAAALNGELADEQASTLTELLAEIERLIRRRRHAGS